MNCHFSSHLPNRVFGTFSTKLSYIMEILTLDLGACQISHFNLISVLVFCKTFTLDGQVTISVFFLEYYVLKLSCYHILSDLFIMDLTCKKINC